MISFLGSNNRFAIIKDGILLDFYNDIIQGEQKNLFLRCFVEGHITLQCEYVNMRENWIIKIYYGVYICNISFDKYGKIAKWFKEHTNMTYREFLNKFSDKQGEADLIFMYHNKYDWRI